MDLKFTVQTRIKKPVEEVFEAVVDGKQICNYFTTKSSGPLTEGRSTTWEWSECAQNMVTVKQLVPNQKIVFTWNSHQDGVKTEVILDFEQLDASTTMVKITESGWQQDETGVKSSYDNCAGWEHMALCLKAYLEHGIDLR